MIKTNDFIVSGFVSQPDGISPVSGDAEVIISNNGAFSNSGVPFKICALIVNGEFSTSYSGLVPAPQWAAASGDTVTFEIRNLNTAVVIPLNVNGNIQNSLSRVLTDQDILARNGNSTNPQGKLDVFLTLAQVNHLHSENVLFRGEVLQPDGTTPVPLGLEVIIENITKNTNFIITILEGEYRNTITSIVGFDSGDQLRFSIRNSFTGNVVEVNVTGTARLSITRVVSEDDVIALGRDPNKGQIVQAFKLNAIFAGLLLPPTFVTTEGLDSRVIVRWSNVFNPNLAGFNVWRSITPSGPFFKISDAPVVGNEYVDMNVFNGTSYFYRVSTVLDDNGIITESEQSAIQQGTPTILDDNFSVRQFLNTKFVAGRTLSLAYSAARISGPANALFVTIKYADSVLNGQQEAILSNPNILSTGGFERIETMLDLPDTVTEIQDIRIRQNPGAEYIVDNVVLSISGNTTDPIARTIIAPAYSSDNLRVIVKNKLPGDLILFDTVTKQARRLVPAGDGTVADFNATDDPVAWAERDQTIVYTFMRGIDANNNILSELRRIEFNQATGLPSIPVTLPDTAQAFFPKINKIAASCVNAEDVVFLFKAVNGQRAIKSTGIRDTTISMILNIPAAGAKSIDVDADGNVVFSTNDQILLNNVADGENRLILDEGSDIVQWGHKKFTQGTLVAYLVSDVNLGASEINTIATGVNPFLNVGNQAEFVLDTSLFPDGPLDIQISSTDKSVSNNQSMVPIRVIVNNTVDVRPMFATGITDPGTVIDKSTVTAPGAITGGITNHCAPMSAGVSSANRGVIEFLTTNDNRLLTTLDDTFTDRPQTIVRRAGIPIAAPIKMRLRWFTDLVLSEKGGTLHPCILTVNTGGVARNIFLPEIETTKNNDLIIYVSEDGSTYCDPQFKCLLRKATNDPLVTVPPELDTLPRFTNASYVNVKWCKQPGAPRDMIQKYVLRRSTEPNGVFVPIFSSLDNTVVQFKDTDLVDGTPYFYIVEAIDTLGNVIRGDVIAFTIIDRTGALEKLGKIQVDLSTEDIRINEETKLEPGTGKIFGERTTFSLSPERNAKSPKITIGSQVFADYTFQKARDIKLRLPPVIAVDTLVGELSSVFVQDRDYIFVKDKNVQGGSTKAVERVRFIRQERTVVEEELVRGNDTHGAEAFGHMFATAIESISMPLTVTVEPVAPVAGFLFQLTNTEPGRKVDGKTQTILEIGEIVNHTKGVTYDVNNIIPNYTVNPTLLQLDIFTNMVRNAFPDPTDNVTITYTYLKVFPRASYRIDRAQNSTRWLGLDPAQPREGQRYLVTYRHLAPIPGERLTVNYVSNGLVRLLQFGDINTGVRGLDEKRHICADVLARETTPVPIDVDMFVTLYDTADEGFTVSEINNTVANLFTGKKLGQGIDISDIAFAVRDIPEVASIKLDPFKKLGRTDTPTLLKIFVADTLNFSIKPGKPEGEVTFFTQARPVADVIIPANTIVSNDLNTSKEILLFEVVNTFRAPLNVIDTFYNAAKNRYEFRVPIRALFTGSATLNRREINTIGGILRNSLRVENERIVEGAVQRQEPMTGNGSFTLQPANGQLLEVLTLQNFTAEKIEQIPTRANFIKLKKSPITNMRGDAVGQLGNSSLIIDDGIVFQQEVAGAPAAPGDYFVNYQQGYIQTFTKTPADTKDQQIRYTYIETYDLTFIEINNETTFTLHGPSNAGKPIPRPGDSLRIDYRWRGDGIPLRYRLETFNTPSGVVDLSFIKAELFNGPIFINNKTEKIENVLTHPEPPFYAYNKENRQLSIVGRQMDENEEVLFQFSTPFGDIDVIMTTFDLKNRENVSRFTFNLDYTTFAMTTIEYLETSGESVTEAPGMTINAGLTVINAPHVVVQLAAVNAKDMVLSEDRLFRDRTDLDFTPFTTAKVFELSDGDGQKTIWAKIRYANPGIQDTVLNASIIRDSLSNEGVYIPLDGTTDYAYSPSEGILRLPTSFGQSDIVINDMESISLNSLNIELDTRRAKRTF